MQLEQTDGIVLQAINRLLQRYPNSGVVASDFISLRYTDEWGDDTSLLSAENIDVVWNLHFEFGKRGVKETYEWLRDEVLEKKKELILRGVAEIYKIAIFESKLLEEAKEKEKLALALQQNLGVLSDIKSCGKCGKEKIYVKVAQTRSIDEGPTSIFTCPKCNYRIVEG